MKIYPAIDIKGGKCVRLQQGNFTKETIFNENPVEVAIGFQSKGASYLHIVDLDGARRGGGMNTQIIKDILASTDLKVQVGGGIRSLEAIDNMLAIGVDRVILGTAAIQNPTLIKEAIKKYGPDKIVVGIDAKEGYVAIEGWEQISFIKALDLCMDMKMSGVESVIFTDIAKDGMLEGPSFKSIEEMIERTGLKIIASGGVTTNEDMKDLSELGCDGAITGKALYVGTLKLEDALRLE